MKYSHISKRISFALLLTAMVPAFTVHAEKKGLAGKPQANVPLPAIDLKAAKKPLTIQYAVAKLDAYTKYFTANPVINDNFQDIVRDVHTALINAVEPAFKGWNKFKVLTWDAGREEVVTALRKLCQKVMTLISSKGADQKDIDAGYVLIKYAYKRSSQTNSKDEFIYGDDAKALETMVTELKARYANTGIKYPDYKEPLPQPAKPRSSMEYYRG